MILGGFDLFEEEFQGLDEARLTQQSLVDTQERMGAVLEALPVGLLIHTQQGIIYSNRQAAELLQASSAALSGQHLLDHVAPEDGEVVQAAFAKAFDSGVSTLAAEGAIDRPDGSRRVAHIILGRLPWAGNPVLQVILQDVTDQKHAEASLRQLTITDELTGAYNRRHAFYEAGLYIDQAEETAPPFSVVMVDIDHFKRINDTFGHGAGDAALIGLTRLFQGLLPSFRDSDSAMLARIGGEEFIVLLPGVQRGRAADIAERLRRALASLKVETLTGTIGLTASMGVATYDPSDGNFDALLNRADEALYAAKQAGRNQVISAESRAKDV